MVNDISGGIVIATNFGEIRVAAGTAPERPEPRDPYVETFADAVAMAQSEGYAVLRGWRPEDYAAALAQIGKERKYLYPGKKNFGAIQPVANSRTLAATRSYMPLHCDNAHVHPQPDFILFYMVQQASSGGETLVVTHREVGPMLDVLGIPEAGLHIRSRRFRHSADRAVFARENGRRNLTFSPLVAYMEFDSRGDFEKLAAAAHALEETMTRNVLSLKSGDAMLIHNKSCMHGRKAFSGDRLAHRVWFS